MSAEDEGGGFLGRWARRKAETRAREAREREAADRVEADGGSGSPDAASTGEAEEPFDLSQLPSLEDIVADTDVSVFLRKGVPEALRNAALRRAWSLDPAIRDYLNPAREYAYDWNVPGGVPGSGPLEAGYDAFAEAARSLSSGSKDAQTLGVRTLTEEASGTEEAVDAAPTASAARTDVVATTEASDAETSSSPDRQPVASEGRAVEAPREDDASTSRRRHGGATPA